MATTVAQVATVDTGSVLAQDLPNAMCAAKKKDPNRKPTGILSSKTLLWKVFKNK